MNTEITSHQHEVAPWLKGHMIHAENYSRSEANLTVVSSKANPVGNLFEYQLLRAFYIGETVHVSIDERSEKLMDIVKHLVVNRR
jgi:hypothetical protein